VRKMNPFGGVSLYRRRCGSGTRAQRVRKSWGVPGMQPSRPLRVETGSGTRGKLLKHADSRCALSKLSTSQKAQRPGRISRGFGELFIAFLRHAPKNRAMEGVGLLPSWDCSVEAPGTNQVRRE